MLSHEYDSQIIHDLEVENDKLTNIVNLSANLVFDLEPNTTHGYLMTDILNVIQGWNSFTELKESLLEMGYEISGIRY